MRHLRSLIAGALLALPISALATDTELNCESPERGADLVACAAARHKVADAKLNSAYKQLRGALKKQDESALDERLRVSQRDWLRFQQSHCEFEATYEGAGSSFVSAKLGDCMAETTTDRTKYLEGLLLYFK
jgi:uncharacterized protein YecT (DUF1311 family)